MTGLSHKSLRRYLDKLCCPCSTSNQATHETEPPLAYVCVLDNHAGQHNGAEIKDYCETVAACGSKSSTSHPSAGPS